MSEVAKRIAKRAEKNAEKTNKPKTERNWNIKGKLLKVTAASALIVSSPYVVELSLTKYQENEIKDAVTFMTQNRQAQCDAGTPTSMATQYQQKLQDVAHGDLVYAKMDPMDVKSVYQSGLKRLAGYVPGRETLAGLAQEYAQFTVPQSYMQDGYQTQIGELAQQSRDLAETGVSVCFDTTLNEKKLGSAFTGAQAMITLNPMLDDAMLSVHLSRQFNIAHQKMAAPMKAFAAEMSDQKMHFSKLQEMQEMANELLSSKAQVISMEGDPNTAPVTAKSGYKPKMKAL